MVACSTAIFVLTTRTIYTEFSKKAPVPSLRSGMKTLFTVMILVAASATSGLSKAYFQNEVEPVMKADAIAIVELSEPKPAEQKGGLWTYRKSAAAKVILLLKGDLSETFAIYGDETFICAQCRLAAGCYLVFLRRDGKVWAGSNWHFSLRPVKNDQIEWFDQSEERHALKFQPSEAVLNRVRDIMKSPPSKTP